MKKHSAFSLIELSIVILIIGVLIAGITQATKLVAKSKLSTAQTATQGSPVNGIKDLVMWLETSTEGTTTSTTNLLNTDNGDYISSWNDINPQSTRKINVVQTISDAERPTYVASGIGGLPSLRFNGTTNFLRIAGTDLSPISQGDDTYTMFIVWQYDAAATNASRIIAYAGPATSTPSDTNRVAAFFIASDNTFGFVASSNNSLPLTIVKGKPYVTAMKINNSLANNVLLYNNTNTVNPSASTDPTTLDLSNSSFAVGYGVDAGAFFQGLISEIIVFDRDLKNAEIVDINNYLGKKYGIKIN